MESHILIEIYPKLLILVRFEYQAAYTYYRIHPSSTNGWGLWLLRGVEWKILDQDSRKSSLFVKSDQKLKLNFMSISKNLL
jgi:hypothetical protein